MGIASLILGIIGLLISLTIFKDLSLILTILGIVLGIIFAVIIFILLFIYYLTITNTILTVLYIKRNRVEYNEKRLFYKNRKRDIIFTL